MDPWVPSYRLRALDLHWLQCLVVKNVHPFQKFDLLTFEIDVGYVRFILDKVI